MISAQVIADSVAPNGKRMTTFVLVYPRFIHSEVMTHRALSRNTASSRAIPVSKMIRSAFWNTAMPVSWGANGKGMQAKAELPKSKQATAKLVWRAAAATACGFSWLLSKLGVHKQLSNRLTEPFSYHTAVVTGTEWENFFALRADPDAQPEFQELAYEMLEAYLASRPKPLTEGEWHLPFWRNADEWLLPADAPEQEKAGVRLKVSVARCARVSYLNFDGSNDLSKDFRLHDDLLANGHMSPFEHQGRAEAAEVRSGNVVGYTQYRKLFSNEVRRLSLADMQRLLAGRRRGA